MQLKKMLNTLTITALFVTSVFMKQVPSYTETCKSEFCFTTPGPTEMKNFDEAKSWCNAQNSTLAVVNDSETQAQLTQFLNPLSIDLTMFINIELSKKGDPWVIVNGTTYTGAVGNQQFNEYKLYCYLKPNGKAEFLVEPSKPSDLRNYLCDLEGTRCQSNSTSNLPFNGRCYVKYENENLTWYQARERCIINGGDLARFQRGSNPWIPPFNTSWLDTSLTYWVGIRSSDWSWKYSDDVKEVIHTSWSTGKPDNVNYSCVCVDSKGIPPWTWSDCDCSVRRQFVCLKIVPTTTVITTTPATTTTTSAATRTPIPATTSTGPTVNTDNSPAPASGNNGKLTNEQIMGLGIGIGGGVLVIVIVATIVLAVFITRRKSKGNDNSESRPTVENNGENNDEVKPTDMTASDGKDLYSQVQKPPRNQVNTSRGKDVYAQVNKHPQNQVSNDVFAKVVFDGKQQINKIESSPEIIYSAPELVQDPKSTPPSSNYEVAYRVHEPDMVPTLRGQTQSIFPIRYSNAYANEKEAE